MNSDNLNQIIAINELRLDHSITRLPNQMRLTEYPIRFD